MLVLAPGKLNLQVLRGWCPCAIWFGHVVALVFICYFADNRPEQMQPPIPHHWNQVISLNIKVHFFPRGPVGIVDPRPIEVDVGCTSRSPKDMQDVVVIFAVLLLVV